MKTPTPDFAAILRTLVEHGVGFVVVGGVGAVVQGAPIATFDLEIVHARDPVNVKRIMAALKELEAWYRSRPNDRRMPDESHLVSPGHQLLMTRYGPLDLLGVVGAGWGFDDLAGRTLELEVSAGLRVRILELAALIRIKEELGRDKDKAVLPVLRRSLEESRKPRE